jgi:hypothetical protein
MCITIRNRFASTDRGESQLPAGHLVPALVRRILAPDPHLHAECFQGEPLLVVAEPVEVGVHTLAPLAHASHLRGVGPLVVEAALQRVPLLL